MNARKKVTSGKNLPLPSPPSPLELDDKILAYARDNAPHKNRWLGHGWTAGLATAGIVVVSLLIIDTQAPQPAVFMDPAPVQKKTQVQRATLEPAEQHSSAEAVMTLSRLSPQPATVASQTAAVQEKLEEAELADDAVAAPERNDAEVNYDSRRQLSAAKAKTSGSIGKGTVQARLLHCADLLQQGEEQQARALYQQLRRACADCALPETLEQAITAMSEAGPAQ